MPESSTGELPRTGPVVGLVLAAGAGRRMGGPKALLRNESGRSWVAATVDALRDGGCDPVFVVLGAAAGEGVAALAADGVGADDVHVVIAPDWQQGMGASLRAGLRSVSDRPVDRAADRAGRGAAVAALVMLVDTPGVGSAVVARMCGVAVDATVLARAAYHGVPGHPVLLGRDHWSGVIASAQGDQGARDYLATRPVRLIECADLGDGSDIDTPPGLPPR